MWMEFYVRVHLPWGVPTPPLILVGCLHPYDGIKQSEARPAYNFSIAVRLIIISGKLIDLVPS